MRERGIPSVVTLCKEAGVSRNTIYNWEGGITAPALDELDKVAARLDVPLSYLVDAWSGRDIEKRPAELAGRMSAIWKLLVLMGPHAGVPSDLIAEIEAARLDALGQGSGGPQPGVPHRTAGPHPPGV